MAFDDTFRLSSHAVILNKNNEVLLLKANYAEKTWGLPGGALEPGETIHEALYRECFEELGCYVEIQHLSGVYYHKKYNSQVFIFRCHLPECRKIKLSDEHSGYRYTPLESLSKAQYQRVNDCIHFNGYVASEKFL